MRKIKSMLGDMSLNSFKLRCAMDFIFFFTRVLGYEASNFHKDLAKHIISNRFVASICPRGHGKTTLVSISYSLWRLWKEKNIKICVVSHSKDQSKTIISEITKHLMENEFLKHLVIKSYKRKRALSAEMVQLKNGSEVFIRPFSDRIRGVHVDYFITDDILREEGTSQRAIKEKFWTTVWPCVHTKKGQLILIGTPINFNDLFVEIEEKSREKENVWASKRFEAVKIDKHGNWVKPLWPSRFDLKTLRMIQKSMGTLRFAREYLCSPLAGGTSIFPWTLLESNIEVKKEINSRRTGKDYYLGVDVASEHGKDFSVFCILERGKDGIGRVVKLIRDNAFSSDGIKDEIHYLDDIFHFKTICIENAGLSVGIVKDLEKDDKVRHRILKYNPQSPKLKEELISNIEVQLKNGNLKLLDNEHLLKELQAFVLKINERTGREQYTGIGVHDDTVLALGMSVMAMLDDMGKLSIQIV
ncbi:hypothetical protein GF386_00890 [Candidatus Pacearchaeota archaeon]|nr:hypothetical protein [Candidatus Pacearchaeota archaeon]